MLRKHYLLDLIIAVALVISCATPGSAAKHKNDSGRLLTGQVFNHENQLLPGSIVYLTDTRTRVVKTYIVGSNGTYTFPALSPNVDYEIYAEFKGRKSDTKTLSQFDDRSYASINLRVDLK